MNCAYELPSLLQLSAEKVASEVNNKYKTMHEFLTHIQLPKIYINYIEDNFFYKTCDFPTYIKESMEKATVMSVIPSVAKGLQDNKYKITVGSEKVLYISTIWNLGMDMLKLDFPEGEYELFEFNDGYILKTKDYTPKLQDVIYVFNNHGPDKGCTGRYYNQEWVPNVDHIRIFNQFISEYLDQDWWNLLSDYPSPHERRVVSIFSDEYYDCVPVLFYITEKIYIDDLSKITLTCPSITKCGNVQVCWYVFHSEKGRIGIAVQQQHHYATMSDLVGVFLLVSNGYRAIGNTDYDNFIDSDDCEYDDIDGSYVCEFEQCFCDYEVV